MNMQVHNPTPSKPAEAGGEQLGSEEIFARISGLPVADKADMLDLLLALPNAVAEPEEMEAVVRAMADILNPNREPVELVKADLPNSEEAEESSPPTQWKKFVARKIRDLRNEREWTQLELADKSQLTQSHVCRIEGQKLSPSRKTIEKIAQAFGVALKELDPSEES